MSDLPSPVKSPASTGGWSYVRSCCGGQYEALSRPKKWKFDADV
jgi:hypothetical protein